MIFEDSFEPKPFYDSMNCNLKQVPATISEALFLNFLGFVLLCSSTSSCIDTWEVTWRRKEEPSERQEQWFRKSNSASFCYLFCFIFTRISHWGLDLFFCWNTLLFFCV